MKNGFRPFLYRQESGGNFCLCIVVLHLILFLLLAQEGIVVAGDAQTKVVNDYPFSLEIPASWKPLPQEDIADLRASVPESMYSLYKTYSHYTGEPFTSVPYLIGYYSPDGKTKFVGMVIRFRPEKDPSASIIADSKSKIEFGIKQGIIKKVHNFYKSMLGEYTSFMLDAEGKDGGRMLSVSLYNPAFPYQSISIMCLYSGSDPNQTLNNFQTALKTLKLDFTFNRKVGDKQFTISNECQRFWIITEASNLSAERVVLLVQEPHWDYVRQWNLHLGLRQFFKDNPQLIGKTAFLAEGARSMETVSVAELCSLQTTPTAFFEKAVLLSFLLPGYLTFDWEIGNRIPVFGTEDWSLYLESARLWKDGKDAAWAVTVPARNVQMVKVLLKVAQTYENPMLFLGGMHLHKISLPDTFLTI